MTLLTKPVKRLKRRRRVRAKVRGSAERPRISAAISPTCCLDAPRTAIRVGIGTSNSIPSGALIDTGWE